MELGRRDEYIREQVLELERRDAEIARQTRELLENRARLQGIYGSLSWRMTRPLRAANSYISGEPRHCDKTGSSENDAAA